jgi:hypothetical protein
MLFETRQFLFLQRIKKIKKLMGNTEGHQRITSKNSGEKNCQKKSMSGEIKLDYCS